MTARAAEAAGLGQRYFAWAEEALQRLERIIEQSGPAKPATGVALVEVYDILHDLKGSSGLFGFDLVTQIADASSALIQESASIEPDLRGVLQQHVSAMRFVIAKRISGRGGDPGLRLVTKLNMLADAAKTRTCGPG